MSRRQYKRESSLGVVTRQLLPGRCCKEVGTKHRWTADVELGSEEIGEEMFEGTSSEGQMTNFRQTTESIVLSTER